MGSVGLAYKPFYSFLCDITTNIFGIVADFLVLALFNNLIFGCLRREFIEARKFQVVRFLGQLIHFRRMKGRLFDNSDRIEGANKAIIIFPNVGAVIFKVHEHNFDGMDIYRGGSNSKLALPFR